MIGFHLSLGYNPEFPRGSENPELKQAMLSTMEMVRSDAQRIVDEVLRIEPEMAADMESLKEMAELCSDKSDLAISYMERDGGGQFVMLASGGMMYQKSSVRRAIARLFIEEMHKKKINVDLTCA